MRKRILLLALALLACIKLYAGDEHNFGQSHEVTYVAADTSGLPVSNLAVWLKVGRAVDDYYYDWSDNTFKASAWVTLAASMTYDSTGGFYARSFTVPLSNSVVSSDYVCIVSVDNSVGTSGYGNHVAETIGFDETNRLIRQQR